MYIPEKMRMTSLDAIYQFIQDYSFATIVSEYLEVTHLPFLLNQQEAEKGTLYCHFARANPHWKELNGQSVVIIFNGPHSYISPTWYATSPAVPTWNYAAVHVYGEFEVLPPEETLDVINSMVNQYEPELLESQQVIPDEYRDRLIKGIVACKIVINKIEGKQKLGQHRTIEDQRSVCNALQSSKNQDSKRLYEYMLKTGIGVGL